MPYVGLYDDICGVQTQGRHLLMTAGSVCRTHGTSQALVPVMLYEPGKPGCQGAFCGLSDAVRAHLAHLPLAPHICISELVPIMAWGRIGDQCWVTVSYKLL